MDINCEMNQIMLKKKRFFLGFQAQKKKAHNSAWSTPADLILIPLKAKSLTNWTRSEAALDSMIQRATATGFGGQKKKLIKKNLPGFSGSPRFNPSCSFFLNLWVTVRLSRGWQRSDPRLRSPHGIRRREPLIAKMQGVFLGLVFRPHPHFGASGKMRATKNMHKPPKRLTMYVHAPI